MKASSNFRRAAGIFGALAGHPTRLPPLFKAWRIQRARAVPNDDRAPTPVVATVEPIARCNLKCPECPVGRDEMERAGDMPLTAFGELWKMFDGKIAYLHLFNQGEPLMLKHFDKIAGITAGTGTFSVASTNGTLLGRMDWPRRLVESGLSELIVSIDGLTQETFGQYRVGAELAEVVEGVKALRRARDHARRGPLITMQLVMSRANEREWPEARAFAESIGCDGLMFKTMQIERLEHPGAKNLIPVDRRFSRYREDADGKLVLNRKWVGCRRVWTQPVVHFDGSLVPCCFDKQSEHAYGNVFKDGFAALWNGEKARKFRRRFIESDSPPLPMCQNCSEGMWTVRFS